MNCGIEIKWRMILAVMNAIWCNCVKKPEKKNSLKSWIFFRLLYAIASNCVHNCEDHPSLDIYNFVWLVFQPNFWMEPSPEWQGFLVPFHWISPKQDSRSKGILDLKSNTSTCESMVPKSIIYVYFSVTDITGCITTVLTITRPKSLEVIE